MNKELQYAKILFVTLLIGITLIFSGSLIWNILEEYHSANEYARIETLASFNKDLLYRRWASMHGGVYVPITQVTPPNPDLSFLPERDIITSTGKIFTLMNPAYMTRQVNAIAEKQYGAKGHITSLNPIRPENKADDWETKALQLFEKGDTEYYSIEKINNQEYMRFMHSMKVEEGCLKCHAKQGYKVGDIRGGISVSIPMEKYNQITKAGIFNLTITHVFIYLLIIALTIIGFRQFLVRLQKLDALQKKIIESEKAYKDVIENTSDLITIVDKHGKILYINHASVNFYGLQPTDCINRFAFDFIFPDDVEFTKSKFKEWLNSDDTQFYIENRHLSASGKILQTAWNVQIERSEKEVLKITSIARDITERKNNELLLKTKNDEIATQNQEYALINEELNKLISDLSQVNDELNTAREEVEISNNKLLQLNADKDRFLSILAHDLKSPFLTIIGFLELLTKNVRNYEIKKIESQLAIISNSAITTYNLLEDLLIWIRSQMGKIPFNPYNFNFTLVCNEVIEILRANANAKNITIQIIETENTTIYADMDMIKTIMRNLLSNAIKFTNSGGTITIKYEQNPSNITISVADTGIGMTPQEMSKLFDVSQTHSAPGTANESGTGLGLLLCKEFVEKHSGKIWVESESGIGSEFKFMLPLFN